MIMNDDMYMLFLERVVLISIHCLVSCFPIDYLELDIGTHREIVARERSIGVCI